MQRNRLAPTGTIGVAVVARDPVRTVRGMAHAR